MGQQIKAEKWVSEYYDWLKNATIVKDVGEWIEESTPFLDRHNDAIQLYVKLQNSGEILMSDDGTTLRDFDFLSTRTKNQRDDIIAMYLKMYGVERKGNELIVSANVENVYQKKHFFIQCIMALNDVMLPRNVKAFNREEYKNTVKTFFDEKKISYVSNIGITGKSGISHSVDFIIPKRDDSPERIISTINKPDVQNAKISTFNLIDIREGRDDICEQIVLLNDTNKEVKPSAIEIFSNYGIMPIKWSERNSSALLEKIA